jgi:hypothetical protein
VLFDCHRVDLLSLISRATENDYNALRVVFELLDDESQWFSKLQKSRHLDEVCWSMREARFIITANGGLGRVPFETQIGDEIYILAGGNMPFVLRPSEVTFSPPGSSDSQHSCYKLVGECYLDQYMDGEFAHKLRDEAVDIFVV